MIADMKRQKRLVGINVRIPHEDRDRIKQLADQWTKPDVKVNESDIVREAITVFLRQSST